MKRFVTIILSLLVVCMPSAHAQQIDSVSRFTLVRAIAPATLITVGSIGPIVGAERFGGAATADWIDSWRPSDSFELDDYIQVLPMAGGLGLGLVGVKAKHNFVDRLIVTSCAIGTEIVLVNTLKYTVKETRPSGLFDTSFPSGHSATAFFGAEIVRREYGWQWGTAAYLVAGTTAFLRLYNERHWLCDVIAGAGIGILCADVGYALLHPVKRLFKLEDKDSQTITVVPYYDTFTGTAGASLALVF